MWKFIKHELTYWLSSPMVWIFLLINTLMVFGAVSSDNIMIGGSVGSVHKNAPYVIQNYYGVMSLVFLLLVTAFMNATANRDFQYNMYQLVFSSPISKRDYYFGKFIGAAIISVIPLLGVTLGSIIAPFMPWVEPQRYGEIMLSGHFWGLISLGIPNVIISGVMLYALAIIYRSNLVSFIGAMAILLFYVVSSGYMADVEKEWLASILDPFGFRPLSTLSKYMTVDEKNVAAVPLTGAFLINRIAWLAVSLAILVGAYFRFSFNTKNVKAKKEKKAKIETTAPQMELSSLKPDTSGKFSFQALWFLIKFETKSIIKNPTFIIITALGLLNLIGSITTFTGRYGADQYPVTYDVIDSIRGSFYLFIVGIIVFYSGLLVWKERDFKINEIQDSTPIKTSYQFVAKLIALLFSIEVIIVASILMGIIAQAFLGYPHFQLDVYFKSLLVMDFLSFAYMIIVALLLHYIINNRYIAYFAFVAFLIANQFVWRLLEINSNMLIFGNTPSVIYSDMNGYGPFVTSVVWFNIYWFIASFIVGYLAYAFIVRGKETGLKSRLLQAVFVLKTNKWPLAALMGIFILCSGFVFYNTQILNTYNSPKESEHIQVDYEKNYKKYINVPRLRYYKFDYQIDIFPYERNLKVHISAWAKNLNSEPISELHFTLPTLKDSIIINIANASIKLDDKRLGYRIYSLNTPINPGDSVLLEIDNYQISRGFENEVKFKQLTQNGTFFNNTDVLPLFGYVEMNEMSDKNKREKYNLPKRKRMPTLDDNNLAARKNPYLDLDADWVEVTTTLSTASDQVAVAPGSLVKEWEEDGRRYFTYKLDHKSLNFYSFISAKFEVAREKWNDIDVEVYYIKQHAYNVANMINSMKKSLEYYTQNFGPYYHKQVRIIEFPRYAGFAQAFPGTMPYSESIGFIADLRDVTGDDIDQVFYVVAHEMAHQYWAHQVCGANMQGSEMMSESFSQYSALMVMEKEYGKDKMKKFLKYEMDGYLKGRSTEFEAERPIMKTEQQGYIHYQKGSVVMYYLKEMIGEQKLNAALRALVDSFGYQEPPYPTSYAAVNEFRKAVPDSLQYLIADLFENITLFSNRIVDAQYKKVGKNYEVTFTTESEKFRADSLGKETTIPIADYIDVGVFGSNGQI